MAPMKKDISVRGPQANLPHSTIVYRMPMWTLRKSQSKSSIKDQPSTHPEEKQMPPRDEITKNKFPGYYKQDNYIPQPQNFHRL